MKKAINDKISLIVTPRTETGKKVRRLRKDGLIPANIYGQNFSSQNITIKLKDFLTTYKKAGATNIVYLQLNKQSIPTLIAQVQRHPINNSILHVDFRQVNLQKKIETHVPVQIVGQSEAIAVKGGVLLTLANELLISALPTNIPQYISVDISRIKEIGQDIKVADIEKSTDYEIKEEPTKVIVTVTAHKEESITPETETVAPEITTAKEEEAAPAAETTTTASQPESKEPKTEKLQPDKNKK